MVQVAVLTLAAYFDDEITAMPNLRVGTLTALTVDDVAVDGKVITMTGSSSDTAVFTAGTNGTLSIVTTDAAAAAANIQITADGTAELSRYYSYFRLCWRNHTRCRWWYNYIC